MTGGRLKLGPLDHCQQPWRIHDVARGFEVKDVWGLRTFGSADDFERLIGQVWASFDRTPTGGARLLWAVRWKLGGWLGWDRPGSGLAARVTPLRDRLPADLVHARSNAPTAVSVPFSPIYRLADEWAAELANGTVHGVLHLGWVATGADSYRGQLAVLVRPNGGVGRLYLTAIAPFRRLIYPAWIHNIERSWTA
jgi:Protein of unknown function (DUF2867)